jgi:hypothetical protein
VVDVRVMVMMMMVVVINDDMPLFFLCFSGSFGHFRKLVLEIHRIMSTEPVLNPFHSLGWL